MKDQAQKNGAISRRDLLKAAGVGVVGASLGSLRMIVSAQSSTADPHSGVLGVYRFTLGDITVSVISDGVFQANTAIVDVPLTDLQAFASSRYINPTAPLQLSTLLIETGNERILLDTGLGANAPTTGKTLAHLNALGIDPAEINRVILTHAHPDHIGGVVGASGVNYPNARYLMNEAEFVYWTNNPDLSSLRVPDEFKAQLLGASGAILPAIQPLTDLIAPETEIAPGISTFDAPGHTPGHIGVRISGGDQTLMYLADATTNPYIGLERPSWIIGLDSDPEQTVETRVRLLNTAADERALIVGYHFPFPNTGYVARDGDMFRYIPVNWMWES
jgi:glyoxylase-like metal-dependent hydrolase (beta-lactamase superfamily II)